MVTKRVFHGSKKSLGVKANGTLSATGTQDLVIDLKKADIHTVTTKTGALSTISLDLKNVFEGAVVTIILTSAVASDALGTVEIEGTDVTTDLIIGALDDQAINLIKITVLDPRPASGSIVMEISTVA